MPKFRYVGPLDEVEVVVRVKQGEVIDVPAPAAGRAASIETDEDGNVTAHDLGEGFYAQPDTWAPVTRTQKPKGA